MVCESIMGYGYGTKWHAITLLIRRVTTHNNTQIRCNGFQYTKLSKRELLNGYYATQTKAAAYLYSFSNM